MALSWLDTVLIIVLLFQLMLGFQQGLVLGLFSLVGYAVGLVAIVAAAPWVAGWLGSQFGWPVGPVLLGVAVAMLVVLRFVTGWVIAQVHLRLADRARLMRANRWLGLFPGAAWGVLSALLIAWVYGAFAGPLPPNSPLASALLARAEQPMNAVAERLPGHWPNIVLLPSGWQVIAGEDPATAVAPTQLEQEMLELVNQERKQAGLAPLAWDGRLAEVGRRHSRDMLAKDYFAHDDPQGATVADRAREARVGYFVIGENLAFAPNLAIAHRGLMESPGHRANILRPGFQQLGIGIVRLPQGEDYTPKHKGQAPMKPPRGYGGYLLVTQVFKR